jgi:penicillin-binding protein 2
LGEVLRKYLNTTDNDWYKQRLTGAIFCVIAAFLVLISRLFYLQVIEREEYGRLSQNNCIRLQTINPQRGLILDRNGNLLVDNRPSFDLCITLKDAKPVEQTIGKLSRFIQVPVEELMSKISPEKGISSYKPVILKSDIGRDALAAIEVHKYDLPGVEVNVKPLRNYINKKCAAHLVGYLSQINSDELQNPKYQGYGSGDFIGKFGVEKTFERFLSGRPGGRQVEVNANGQIVRILKTVEAKPGHNIYLTIVEGIQKKAEELLADRAGAVVAMEPATGEILAMASSPAFDQNAFVSGMSHEEWNSLNSNPFRPMTNKVIQGEYPPASTYKIVTAIAGLEEGVIDENTEFYCPGHYRFGDRVFQCWKRGGHGYINVVKALAQSCDVFFYQVGERLGIDRLAWYAKACGLGSETGICLDHESQGLVPTAAWKKLRTGISWQAGETLSICIGQGYNLTTPLQMLCLISAVANNGIRHRPIIIKKIETADGEIVFEGVSQIAGPIPASKKTLDIVGRGLWEVVNNVRGTASIARLDGINISGKTGTAQVVGRKKNDKTRDEDRLVHLKPHAWFVAYAPSDDPEIAVAVLVEHGEHGSSAAAPIAKELIKAYLLKGEPVKSDS